MKSGYGVQMTGSESSASETACLDLLYVYVARRQRRTSASRDRILAAVRSLLEDGTFHERTVEEVAERAGVSRATLYGHFGSRLGLVDAMCESFDANPALVALRETDDLDVWVQRVVEFWSSEEKVLAQLYGAAAVDPAARDLVERQTRDRYGELKALLHALGRNDGEALAALGVLTSFETYLELRRRLGRPRRQVVATLQHQARTLLAD
jgi:AcrR family transcriptional regulator